MVDTVSRNDNFSTKSGLLRTNMMNTDTFNVVSQLPKTVKQKIIRDGDMLTNAPTWCEEIWKTMRKNDFATQGVLNMPVIENVFAVHSKKIQDMLGLSTPEELFNILDTDSNGSISEDEQVLIFSIIKEKMAKVAEDLCNIQDYVRYKEIMKGIRKMEALIAKFQDFLRRRIYQSELDIYHQVGENKLDDFYKQYEEEFKRFDAVRRERITELQLKQSKELHDLTDKLDRAVVALKFKPKTALKEYQKQEKLVSIDERVEEALNYRKELKDLEVSEAMRIRRLREDNIDHQRNNLIKKHQKEMSQLILRLENDENNLIIHMKKEFDILRKKIHLHENEIKRIQGIAAKYAYKKGIEDGELRRDKEKSKKLNSIITASKSITAGFFSPTVSPNITKKEPNPMTTTTDRFKKTTMSLGTLTLNTTFLSAQTNINQIQYLSKSPGITSFYLQRSFGEDRPVNLRPVNYANEDKLSHKKVELYLKSEQEAKIQSVPPLTALYDNELNHREKTIFEQTETMSANERLKRRQFIDEKLAGDKRVI